MNGQDFSMLERAIARSKAEPNAIEYRADETVEGIAWTGPLRGSDG